MAAFLAILGATFSGLGGLGPWSIALAALALWASSRAEYAALYGEAERAGLTAIAANTSLKSFANAVIATSAAFGGGVLLRLVA